MQRLWPRRTLGLPGNLRTAAVPISVLPVFAGFMLLAGCASPGPPRPPSLQLPRLVSDLAATRSGNAVTLQFSVSPRTTDGQPLRGKTVQGSLCRQIAGDARCLPVDADQTRTPINVPANTNPEPVIWTDVLPPALAAGAPRAIAYRVELKNEVEKSAGLSDPVYAAAGAAPAAVAGLRAQGTRLGVELTWQAGSGAGEVLLERTELDGAGQPFSAPAHEKRARTDRRADPKAGHTQKSAPGVVWLHAAPGDSGATSLHTASLMDAGVAEGVRYRYRAVRRETVQVGGRSLELRSELSGQVSVAWRDVYPPPVPAGLTALGYFAPSATGAEPQPASPPASTATATAMTAASEGQRAFAVDLIWQPVSDTRLAGYVVYRQRLGANDEATGVREKLTPEPLVAPGFHDASALPDARYRYAVTSIDPKGNESAAATAMVEASARP